MNQPESGINENPVQENTPPAKPTFSHFSQGVEHGLSGKYEEAVGELTQSVQGNPRHIPAQTSLGVAFHRLGQEDRALSCYEAALKIDPRSAEAHYFRANILYGRGNVREAITEYTTAVGLKPELIDAHLRPIPRDRLTDYSDTPAGIYRITRHALRILELDKALESDPKQANLFKERAFEYSRLGNYEQAVADYDACLALQPDDAGALHYRGLAYEQMGQPDRASKDFQQATSTDPQLSDVYINRGVKFGEMGQFRQSIESLTEGIRLAPQNPNGYFNRGTTYFQSGDFDKAIIDFSKVIELSANDEDAYYWRAISNEEAGRRREAAADYQQFLKLSQNPWAREEIEQKLDEWNAEKPNLNTSLRTMDEAEEKINQNPPEEPAQELDLYALIISLGQRALSSTWVASEVDCDGEKAEELYSFTDNNKPIPGHELLEIASGIRKTFEGDFTAYDPNAASHWLFIRAWNGKGFYIETNDPETKRRLQTKYQSTEEVQDVPPPYEGLFIQV
jgi:tetratricopeptide (TPR) repeat protein